MPKARSPIWKSLVPVAMLFLAVAVIAHSMNYERSTVLLTSSLGAYLLAFLAGFLAAAAILWATRRGWEPEREVSDITELKTGCAVFLIVMLWGGAGVSMTGEWRGAQAFRGTQLPLIEADYPITGTDDGKPRRRGFFYRRPDHPTITITAEDGAINGVIPVPAALVAAAGDVRDDSLLEQKCLSLHIQQSGEVIRAVVRGADGEMLEMQVHRCNPGPPPRATAPS